MTNFSRTYDGAKYNDETRNMLPVPNLIYKILDMRYASGDANAETQTEDTPITATGRTIMEEYQINF